MCSMMPAIRTSSPSRKRVHVDFGGILEEAVDQDRTVLREATASRMYRRTVSSS